MAKSVCIITGAGRGIGRATAIELSSRGFDCVLVARSAAQLLATQRELKTDAFVHVADVRDAEAFTDLIDRTLERFGRIDAVVNCAGVAPSRTIEETDAATWHAVIETNLSSAFYLAKAAWAELKKSRGAIVNIGSEASRDPFPGFLAYATAKAGLTMFTQVLHREGKPHGVRSYCVAPAAVETGMFRSLVTREQYGTDKTLDPADVARTIAACVAGDLRYASGETIYIHKE